jgi:hypothetical protein
MVAQKIMQVNVEIAGEQFPLDIYHHKGSPKGGSGIGSGYSVEFDNRTYGWDSTRINGLFETEEQALKGATARLTELVEQPITSWEELTKFILDNVECDEYYDPLLPEAIVRIGFTKFLKFHGLPPIKN